MRNTPETDDQPTINAINDYGYAVPCVDIEYARKLERERDEAIIKYTGEANELERQRNHAIAKCEDARRDLAEAKEALKKIKHIYINGGDTYLDFVRVGNIATDYLEGL